MNSLKTMFVVAVLAAVAYGVYTTINNNPAPGPPPPGASDEWAAGPPSISLPQPGAAPGFSVGSAGAGTTAAGQAPPFAPSALAGSDASMAPPFAPSAPLPPGVGSTVPPPASSGAATTPPMPPAISATQPPTSGPIGLAPGLAATSPQRAAPAPSRPTSPAAGQASSPFAEFLRSARSDLDDGKLTETLAKLSAFYGDTSLSEEESRQLVELLDQVAGTVIYSTGNWLEPAYEVKPGDTLESIAEHHRVPRGLLAKINGIDPAQPLRPGQKLKVLDGPFDAVVHLDRHELTLMLQDRYAGRFPIGVGLDQPHLEGTYSVLEKQINPAYYDPAGHMIEPDDPANPLGQRKLGLGKQVAIHGTNDPAKVGRTGGRGTICLSRQDAEDVYDILSVGSRVVIRR